MIKADNQAIDFVMRIINQVMKNEYDFKTIKNMDSYEILNARLELWYCFLEQYQIKKTPKLGIMVLEIV